MVNGEVVKPTEEDVDTCVSFLEEQESLICDKTVRSTILKYKRGEIIIQKSDEEKGMQPKEESNNEEKEKILREIKEHQKELERLKKLATKYGINLDDTSSDGADR